LNFNSIEDRLSVDAWSNLGDILHELYLGDCRLKSLPARMFDNMHQLRYLHLWKNQITDIPSKFFQVIFTAKRYASTVYAMVLCSCVSLSVCQSVIRRSSIITVNILSSLNDATYYRRDSSFLMPKVKFQCGHPNGCATYTCNMKDL